MTARARRFIAGAQHSIGGRNNGMIAVAGCAARKTHLDKNFAVRAFVEQL